MKIVAEGIKDGKKLTVVCEGTDEKVTYLFNGETDYGYEFDINLLLLDPPEIGGVYSPKTLPMQILSSLMACNFFDEPPEFLEVEGIEEKMPFKPGVIY